LFISPHRGAAAALHVTVAGATQALIDSA
jgi:hypothetical protein